MDKVTAYYIVPTSFSPSSQQSSMPMHVRGHHSSVNKAVNAHRQMAEERSHRQSYRKLDSVVQPLTFVEDNRQNVSSVNDVDVSNGNNDLNSFVEHEYIDPSAGPAKQAVIQSFQTTEPGRPVVGEPVPKGTYLDVEG